MRVNFVFLVAAAALFASSEIATATTVSDSTSISSTRSLRSHKTAAMSEERTSEERAAEERELDANILDKILADHAYAKQLFRSWLQNGQTKENIENKLKVDGLLEKYSSVAKQYGQYLTILEGKSA